MITWATHVRAAGVLFWCVVVVWRLLHAVKQAGAETFIVSWAMY